MKKFLSILLILVTVLSVCAIPAFSLSGSEEGGGGYLRDVAWHGRVPAGSGASYSQKCGFYTDYFESSKGRYCIRMRAFPLTEDKDQGYFLQYEGEDGKKVVDQVEPEKLVEAPGYNTVKGWIYFCDGANYNPNGAWAQDKRDCFPIMQFF